MENKNTPFIKSIAFLSSFALLIGLFNNTIPAQAVDVTTFNYTGGSQSTTLQPGTYTFEVWGAKGGGGSLAGNGGYIKGTIGFLTATNVQINVGGIGATRCAGGTGGFIGGGAGGYGTYYNCNYSGGGGGASDIRIGGTTLSNRIIVAGGGGGASGGTGGTHGGGAGGYPSGSSGDGGYYPGGGGGTATAGGAGAASNDGSSGTNGSLGIGGTGGVSSDGYFGGGGGGGGYYGGGGGTGDTSGFDGGGGGGSSYVSTTGSYYFTDISYTNGVQNGNGQVVITKISDVPTVITRYDYTGSSQIISMPAGNYVLETWGASGGGGGAGGYMKGNLTLNSTYNAALSIGGAGGSKGNNGTRIGGFNGGGNGGATNSNYSNGGGGGGATDIRINGTTLNNRVIVAGGGGGGAGYNSGGTGGYPSGSAGGGSYPGGGGTSSAGGFSYGSAASAGFGGNGGTSIDGYFGGGGGGGGYYGGGAGTGDENGYDGGGGGGSSFASTSGSFILTNTSYTNGTRTGNGYAIITYTPTTPTITSVSPSTGSVLGGTIMTINGTFLTGATAATVGSATCNITNVTDTAVTCTIAAGSYSAGAVNVSVTTPGGTYSTANSPFTFQNPSPTTFSISPTSKFAGDAQFTLTVNGSNFVPSSLVNFDGAARTTSYVSSSQLTAIIPATDLSSGGIHNITVSTGTPGGGTSGAQTFTVNNLTPILSNISPTTVTAGATGVTLTVNGSNFVNNSVIKVNGTSLATTFVNSTQLTATIDNYITSVGSASFTVFSPTPGGGTSGSASLTISAGNSNLSNSTITASPNPATNTKLANGSDYFTVTVHVRNSNNVPVPNRNVTLNADGVAFASGTTGDGNNGTTLGDVSFQINSNQAKTVMVTATDTTVTPSTYLDQISLTFTGPTAGASTFTNISNSLPANNTDTSIMTVTLKDAGNNVFTGRTVTVSQVSGTANPTFDAVNCSTGVSLGNNPSYQDITAADGKACFKIRSASAGNAVIKANSTETGDLNTTISMTFTAAPTTASLSRNQSLVAGGETITLNGTDFVAGATVSVGGTNATVGTITATTIEFTLPAKSAGTYDVVITNPDTQTSTLSQALTYYSGSEPAATALGNSSEEFSIAQGDSATITFNLPIASGSNCTFIGNCPNSKLRIENAISALASRAPSSFEWNEQNTAVTIHTSNNGGATTFSQPVVAAVTDVFGQIPADVILLINTKLASHQVAGGNNVNLSSNIPEAVITSIVQPNNLAIPSNVTTPVINLRSLLVDNSVTVPPISATIATENSTVEVAIPSSTVTTLNPSDSWDGTLSMGESVSSAVAKSWITPDAGQEVYNVSSIKFGSNTVDLSFAKGVQITFQGNAGKRVGYYNAENQFAEVLNTCNENSQSYGDSLANGAECKIDSGNNLIVWTRHFTDYVIYEEAFPPTVSNITPNQGNIAGGDTFIITGTNFGTGATVTFDQSLATEVTVDSNTQITAKTPAHSAGTVNVKVSNPNGLFATLSSGFEYINNPPSPVGPSAVTNATQNIACNNLGGDQRVSVITPATPDANTVAFEPRNTDFYNDPTNAPLNLNQYVKVIISDDRGYDPGTLNCGLGYSYTIQSNGLFLDGNETKQKLSLRIGQAIGLNKFAWETSYGPNSPISLTDVFNSDISAPSGDINTAVQITHTTESFLGQVILTLDGNNLEVIKPATSIPAGNYSGTITVTQI